MSSIPVFQQQLETVSSDATSRLLRGISAVQSANPASAMALWKDVFLCPDGTENNDPLGLRSSILDCSQAHAAATVGLIALCAPRELGDLFLDFVAARYGDRETLKRYYVDAVA